METELKNTLKKLENQLNTQEEINRKQENDLATFKAGHASLKERFRTTDPIQKIDLVIV